MRARKTACFIAVVALALIGLAAPALASDHRGSHHTTHASDRHDKRSNSTWWSELSRGNNHRSDRDRDGDRDRDRREDRRDRNHNDNDDRDDRRDRDDDSGSSDTGTDTVDSDTVTDTGTGDVIGEVPATTGAEETATFRITGFGKIDNTPRGSTTISMPVIHREAGGTGTFLDPLTAASPGSANNTESPKGARFYVPHIHRYVIIEDSGASKFSQPHLDIWSGTTDNVEDCEAKITGTFPVIKNPKDGHPVTAGPIANESGCNI